MIGRSQAPDSVLLLVVFWLFDLNEDETLWYSSLISETKPHGDRWLMDAAMLQVHAEI